MTTTGNIHFSITADNDDFKRKLAETRQGIIDSRKMAEIENEKIQNMIERTSHVAMNSLSVDKVKEMGDVLGGMRKGETVNISELIELRKIISDINAKQLELEKLNSQESWTNEQVKKIDVLNESLNTLKKQYKSLTGLDFDKSKVQPKNNSAGVEQEYDNAVVQQKEQALETEAALERSYITDSIKLIEYNRDAKLKAIEEERKAYVKRWTDRGIKPENIDTSSFDRKGNVVKNEANGAMLSEYKSSLEERLKEYQGYFEKEKAIEEKYAEDEKFLKDRNTEVGGNDGAILSALSVLNEKKQAELDELNIFYASKEEEFMNFCERIANFNVDQLKNALTVAKKEVDELGNSKDTKVVAVAKAKVATASVKLEKAQVKKDNSLDKKDIKQWKNLKETLEDVSKSFEEIGKEIGGVVGESIASAGQLANDMISMTDQIITFATTGVQGIKSTTDVATKALKTVESASVILAIISTAIQVAMKIAELFSKDRE